MQVLYCRWEFNGLQLWAICSGLMKPDTHLGENASQFSERQVVKRRFVTGQPKGGCEDGDATD